MTLLKRGCSYMGVHGSFSAEPLRQEKQADGGYQESGQRTGGEQHPPYVILRVASDRASASHSSASSGSYSSFPTEIT
jgi:hypothetical protein